MSKKLKDIIWIKNADNFVPPNTENVSKVRDLLNSTGNGFCLAKFTQGTLHLGTGMTHACHHPSPHKISIEEIQKDPAALFNSSQLKKARSQMVAGERPSECDYCWRVEDKQGNSDRFYKSLENWALNNHDNILEKDPTSNFYPTYLEVDFSNVCNFSCTYCGPEFSSKWVENLKQHGPIKLLDNTKHVQWAQGWQDLDKLNYKNSEFNPYVDAFWKWFPEAYKHLKVYRITGGEPLLSKETFRSIDWFLENPNVDLEFGINTNLGAPQKIWDEFIEKIKKITTSKCVKKFTVFTSVDGWGKQAEYARPGLDFELFKKRYEELLNIDNVRAVIMCTINIFSITSIKQLLEWQVHLKKKYNTNNMAALWEEETGFNINHDNDSFTSRKEKNTQHVCSVGIDLPYLRSPTFLDAQIADRNLIQNYIIPAMNFFAENTAHNTWNSHQGFEEYELEKFKRVCINLMYFIKQTENSENTSRTVLIDRAKFFDFVNDIDKRHKRNFLEYFPEMKEFYDICKQAKKIIIGEN